MKAAAAPLVTFLNANTVGALAELYTLTLQSGAVARWTTSYADMVWDGFTFTAAGSGTSPGVVRGSITETSGLDVGALKLTLEAGDAALVNGVRVPLAAVTGRFSGARLKVQRAVLDAPGGTVQGVVTRFEGTVAGVAPTSTGVTVVTPPVVTTAPAPVPPPPAPAPPPPPTRRRSSRAAPSPSPAGRWRGCGGPSRASPPGPP